MIKFFRKIRQNLLSEGKTGKYLKYAIGEIVLVVIGILIALQLNNWNENNKNDILLNENLVVLMHDMENDIEDIKRIKKHYDGLKPLFLSIIKDSIKKEEFINYKGSSSLLTYIPDWTIEQKGILLIRNNNNIKKDSLINSISDTYNHFSKLIIQTEVRLSNNNYENIDYYKNNFDWFHLWCLASEREKITEKINESLYQNKEFKNRLGERYIMIYINYLESIKLFEIELIKYLKLIKARIY